MSKKKSLEPGVEEELYVFSQDMTKVFHVVFSQLGISEALPSLHKNYEQHGVFMFKEHVMCVKAENNACGRGAGCRDVHLAADVTLASL